MKSKRRSISLQSRITALCIVIAAIAVLLVGGFQYIISPRILQQKAGEITEASLETVSASLNQRINSVLAFASTFVSNSEISAALTRARPRYTYEDATLISTVFRLVTVANENLIDSIVVFTNAGKLYVGGNGAYLSPRIIESRFAVMEEELERSNWVIRYELPPMRNYATMTGVRPLISLYYILRDTVSLERVGVIYFSLNPDILLPSPEDETDRAFLLLDDRGQAVAASPGASLSPALLEALAAQKDRASGRFLFGSGQNTAFAVYTGAAVSGWRLVEYIPYQSLIGEARRFVLLLTEILVVAFAAILLLTIYGARKSLAPLRRLRDSMLAVQEGNYDVRVEEDSDKEIGELARTYNLMLSRIKQLIGEIYASEKQKREIELQVLQMQVNPHFLYNTLNSIHWMAVMHGLDSISDMVDALVGILRHSLQDFHELTTLREEMDTLQKYLYIQNVRFNNGITLDSDIDPTLLEERIPRLLLQPMVENAVLHGIRLRGGRGRIVIRVQADEVLRIDITDDGAGFPMPIPSFVSYDDLGDLLPASGHSFSIGLKNTHERIRLRFGEGYGLSVRSGPASGTTIRLLLARSLRPEAALPGAKAAAKANAPAKAEPHEMSPPASAVREKNEMMQKREVSV